MAKIGEFEMSKIAPLALKDVSSSSFLFRFSFSSLHLPPLIGCMAVRMGRRRERESGKFPNSISLLRFFGEKKVSVVKEEEAGE